MQQGGQQRDVFHDDVFHAGECAAQQRSGVRERLAEMGPRVIRDYMPEQHREFFTLLPWLPVGSVDRYGQPWASVLTGKPGFATSPDAQHLNIRAHPLANDPLSENLRAGTSVGVLGLQPHTRRRNRMNGVIEHRGEDCVSVRVQQSFGNCPKYIQAREATFTDISIFPSNAERITQLDAAAKKLIAEADTFFIATTHPAAADNSGAAEGVDISHRGGRPGFIHVTDDSLTVPDYSGNFFFNTIGNLLLEPRAGLLFIDFESNDVLQLAVQVELIWDAAALTAFAGAQRLLRMHVTGAIRHHRALPLVWGKVELSPFLPAAP